MTYLQILGAVMVGMGLLMFSVKESYGNAPLLSIGLGLLLLLTN